jgi:hypothetical protein
MVGGEAGHQVGTTQPRRYCRQRTVLPDTAAGLWTITVVEPLGGREAIELAIALVAARRSGLVDVAHSMLGLHGDCTTEALLLANAAVVGLTEVVGVLLESAAVLTGEPPDMLLQRLAREILVD